MRTIARVKRAITALAATGTTIALVAGTVAAAHRRRCRFGSIFLPLLFLSVSVFAGGDGDRPTITFSELYQKGRPADFYNLDFSADDKVCGAALKLLNEPSSIPPGLRMPYDYAKIDTALFLSTASGVAWEQAWLTRRDVGKPRRDLDVAKVDLFNSGTPVDVFRIESYLSGFRIHILLAPPVEQAVTVFRRTEETIDGSPMYEQLTPAREYRIEPNDQLAGDTLRRSESLWRSPYVFMDILHIDANYYVLVMSSGIGDNEHIQSYLLEFHDYNNQQLLCAFRSHYKLR